MIKKGLCGGTEQLDRANWLRSSGHFTPRPPIPALQGQKRKPTAARQVKARKEDHFDRRVSNTVDDLKIAVTELP